MYGVITVVSMHLVFHILAVWVELQIRFLQYGTAMAPVVLVIDICKDPITAYNMIIDLAHQRPGKV